MLTAQFRRALPRVLALILVVFFPLDLFAQDNSSDQRAALLQELEAMRKRIDQIEAQIKRLDAQHSASESSSTSAANSAAKNTSAPSITQEPPPAMPNRNQISEPFSFADFTWLNGNSREKNVPLDTKFFTPEFRADVSYIYDFNHPKDDTLVGSSESGRTQEIQLQQLGIGGDFHYDNVRGTRDDTIRDVLHNDAAQ